jgi:hypothetical protein
MVAPARGTEARTTGDLDLPIPARARAWASVRSALEHVWLAGALMFALLFAARRMAPLFSSESLIPDDLVQYVFWMAAFRDPELFREDLIAEYYRAVVPPAYTAMYWTLSWLVEPLLATKLLPLLLALSTALFTFLLVRRLHPAPAAAFLSAVLLSWFEWRMGDLATATPRSFTTALLVAQLWTLVTGRLVASVCLVALAALIYPSAALIGVALLGFRLVRLRGWRPALEPKLLAWAPFVLAVVLSGGLLLHTQNASSRFGPLVSVDQAREMREFGPLGIIPTFYPEPYRYWISGQNTGAFPIPVKDPLLDGVYLTTEYLAVAALLPVLLLFRRRLTVVRQLSPQAIILLQLLAASYSLFLLAHMLLFHLYHPNRYVVWSQSIVLSIAAGLALGMLIQMIAEAVNAARSSLISGLVGFLLGVGLALHPGLSGGFRRDPSPAVTNYLRGQPKDVLVAGPPSLTDFIPVFAERRVLVGREIALPYHLGYYDEIRSRSEDLIEAYYAQSLDEVTDFTDRYGVDFLLVHRDAFDRLRFERAWYRNWEPFTSRIWRQLQRPRSFALLHAVPRCAVFDDGTVAIVATTCLRDERWS